MLMQQYVRLRSWLVSLKTTPYGHEFYKPISFLVRVVAAGDGVASSPFRIYADQVDMSRWGHRYIPALPTIASTKTYGSVDILQVQREPDILRFYQHTMSTDLADIRCRDVWYIVYGWHLYVHTSTASEYLAEAVGSFLSVARRHNTNGNMSMKHLVWSSQLRAFGLKGFGGEDGIMAYALNTHFQCPGPEGWHFVSKRVKQERRMGAAELQKELRLLGKPNWFHTYWQDLLANGALSLCKHLPRPERVLLSSKDASIVQQFKPTAKRQTLSKAAGEQYNPGMLHDGLWQRLQICTLSLPACLRPGKQAR